MDFVIKQSLLAAELNALAAMASKTTALPILNNVLVESLGGVRLRLTATTLETTLTSEIIADAVQEEGKLCAPARRFYDVVRLMPDGLIHITTDEHSWVTVQAGTRTRGSASSRNRMHGMDPQQWPPLPSVEGAEWTEVPSEVLRAVIKGVDYAVAPEEDSRFSLRGCRLEIEGSQLRVVATDGHRLAYAQHALEAFTLADVAVLIPQRGTGDLLRLLADHEGTISCALNGHHLFFRAGSRLLCLGLLAGDFPLYRNILAAATHQNFATFRSDELLASLRRVLLAADGKSAAVKFQFVAGDLNLRAQTAESGEAEESLASDWTGEDTRVWANAKFLLEFLTSVGAGTVRWEMGGARNPLHLIGIKDGLEVQYVCMPLDIPDSDVVTATPRPAAQPQSAAV